MLHMFRHRPSGKWTDRQAAWLGEHVAGYFLMNVSWCKLDGLKQLSFATSPEQLTRNGTDRVFCSVVVWCGVL